MIDVTSDGPFRENNMKNIIVPVNGRAPKSTSPVWY